MEDFILSLPFLDSLPMLLFKTYSFWTHFLFLDVNYFHQNVKFVTEIQHVDTQKFKTQYLKTQLVLKLYKSSALAKTQIYMRK